MLDYKHKIFVWGQVFGTPANVSCLHNHMIHNNELCVLLRCNETFVAKLTCFTEPIHNNINLLNIHENKNLKS